MVYPSLVHQLIRHDRYKFQSAIGAYEDKTATLTDADSVWTDVRHMHMREAMYVLDLLAGPLVDLEAKPDCPRQRHAKNE